MDASLRTTRGRKRSCVECIRTQYLKDEVHELSRVFRDWFLSRERGKKKGLSVNSDEI